MTPSLLVQVFERLNAAGVRYCLLRGNLSGPAERGHRELDILLDPRDLGAWARELDRLGFVSMPVLGSAGHRFFTAYDTRAGEWVKLDVVTRVRLGGRAGLYSLPGREVFLERASRQEGTPVLSTVDAVLTLTLHCLLDKRAFKPGHRATLSRLRSAVEADANLTRMTGEGFRLIFGDVLSWKTVSSAIATGDWPTLLARRREVAQALVRRDPIYPGLRALDEFLRRMARPAHAVLARRGFSVALVGPDGTGKSSLARRLAQDPEIRARIVYMGSNPAATTVGLWPGGATGFLPVLIEQTYRSLVASYWKARGRFVVFERHPIEGRNNPPRGMLSRLRRALLLASGARPDLLVVLDAPVDVLLRRAPEHGRERVESQRQRYLDLARQTSGAKLIDTSLDSDQTIRPLIAALWTEYRRRVDRGPAERA